MSKKKNLITEQGLEAWYRQTVSKLYSFTYALLQNREEAEDITQEAYFRCLRKDASDFPPYPYLKKIARNLIYDRYRHWHKTTSQIDDNFLFEDISASEKSR